MDWLTFFSRLVSSLAWPVSILLILLIMRKPLRDILSLLHRLRYKDFEVEFNQRVDEVKIEAEQALPKESGAVPSGPDAQHIIRLSKVSPRAAVLEAWRRVELAAIETAQQLGGEKFRNKTLTYQAIRFIEQHTDMDSKLIMLLRHLRGLRNKAAHAPEFALSTNAALEYAKIAELVARHLHKTASRQDA